MQDLYHFWGGDLAVSANGDLLVTDPTTTGEQRVLRRLLTNPTLNDANGQPQASADYTFAPSYGAGLPRAVGMPVNIAASTALIASQMAQEAAVSQTPAPVIQITPIQSGVNAFIMYNDAASKLPVVLNFDVTQ